MQTEHLLLYQDSRRLEALSDQSIDLAVTSPPYPMIEMWDSTFTELNCDIGKALDREEYRSSFQLMHRELDKVWAELYRVLKPGGFACINVGEATRSFKGRFLLFPNHSRILQGCWEAGFDILPSILWRKQTNAPNKYMGSGMLPAGAYVTLEHEYILIARKGSKRIFSQDQEKIVRQESAIFWEERNTWYSDLWDFKGARQTCGVREANNDLRRRSGAYPFLLPYRLINMFSVYGDTVLDPFLGTGTSTLAALAGGRNSVGVELDPHFTVHLEQKMAKPGLREELNRYPYTRLLSHLQFVEKFTREKEHPPKYNNEFYGFPVVTRQEKRLKLLPLQKINKIKKGHYLASYGSDREALELAYRAVRTREAETVSFFQQRFGEM